MRKALITFWLIAVLIWAPLTAHSQVQGKIPSPSSGRTTQLRQELKSNPNSLDALAELGSILAANGNYREAIAILSRRNRLGPDPRISTLLAVSYCQLAEYPRAMHLLHTTRLSQNSDAAEILAPCAFDAADFGEAAHFYRQLVVASAEPRDENLVNLAQAEYKAEAAFVKQLKQAPNSEPFLAKLRAAAATGTMDVPSEIAEVRKSAPFIPEEIDLEQGSILLEHHTNNASLLFVLAILAGDDALKTILRAEEQFPDSPSVRAFRAKVLAAQGRGEQAKAEYEKLLASPRVSAGILQEAGAFYVDKKDWESALNAFQRELAINHRNYRALAGVSNALMELARYPEEIKTLQPYLVQADRTGLPAWAYSDMAEAEQAQGDVKAAARTLRSGIAAYPAKRSLHYRLSQIDKLLGDRKEAAAEMATFLSLKAEQ